MAPQLLSHVGPPRISTRADIALLLLAATTFFLLVTALASPTWREFDSAAGSLHLSIGLFRACAKRLSFADGIHWECGAAWGADSPLRRFQFLDLFGEFDSESTVAPPAVGRHQCTC